MAGADNTLQSMPGSARSHQRAAVAVLSASSYKTKADQGIVERKTKD